MPKYSYNITPHPLHIVFNVFSLHFFFISFYILSHGIISRSRLLYYDETKGFFSNMAGSFNYFTYQKVLGFPLPVIFRGRPDVVTRREVYAFIHATQVNLVNKD